MEKVKIVSRGKTQKYTDNEYKEKLKEITNDNIICLENYITANVSLKHYCIKHNCEFNAKPSKFTRKNNPQKGCKQCGIDYNTIKNSLGNEEFKRRLFNIWNNEFIFDDEYINSSTKVKFIHNTDTPHIYYATPNSILSGEGCGVCRGLQVCSGYNDIYTKDPEFAKLFVNENDARNNVLYSSNYADFKCPNCGEIYNKKIKNVYQSGFSCKLCSDGISYPNKFIYNLLKQIENQLDFLISEYTPEWGVFYFKNTKRKSRYDIYFGINGKQYIVEMDGGLGHGNKTFGDTTSNDSLYIDEMKNKLAIEHNIQIIRIDCFYDHINNRYEYIKNNIKSSYLNEIININILDFYDANLKSNNSKVKLAADLWNKGLTESQISKELNCWISTVNTYLHRANEIGLCDNFSPKSSRRRSTAHETYCITDKKYFDSIVEASEYYGINVTNISRCCRKIYKNCKTNENRILEFCYYSEIA